MSTWTNNSGIWRDASGPIVVTICGSLRFTREMIYAHHVLSNQGYLAFLPNINLEDPIPTDSSPANDREQFLHDSKISFGDAIYIVNVGGYIGESTFHEYKLAQKLGKKIFWWDDSEESMNKTRERMIELDKK